MHQIRNLILDLLYLLPLDLAEGTPLKTILVLAVVLVAVGAIEILLRLLFLKTLPKLISRVKEFGFADNLTLQKIISNLIRIFSIQLFKNLLPVSFPEADNVWRTIFGVVISIYTVILLVQIMGRLISSLRAWLLTSSRYRNNPMVNLLEVLRIVIYFIAGLYIISILFSVDMKVVFGSLAALSAVMMLVFKDTIMGVVASIQLSGNDMLRVGDWITVPKYGVDGTVEDVSLTTVKIRNFDNTVSTIPPYSLITETFQNWRFMEESGGRRVQRSLYIDMNSIRFVDDAFVTELRKAPVIGKYIDEVLDNYSPLVSERKTNFGLLRKYVEVYLKHLDAVNTGYSCLVHTKAPTEQGIPMQLNFFSKATDWVTCEAVAGEVFDHLIAIVPYFDLKIFQRASGDTDVLAKALPHTAEPGDE